MNFLDAGTFKEEDRVGVMVDLLAGFLLFVRNGEPQGMRIPIDRSKKYLPVFSACACYNLQLIPDARPPWNRIYSIEESCRGAAKEIELLESSSVDRQCAVATWA